MHIVVPTKNKLHLSAFQSETVEVILPLEYNHEPSLMIVLADRQVEYCKQKAPEKQWVCLERILAICHPVISQSNNYVRWLCKVTGGYMSSDLFGIPVVNLCKENYIKDALIVIAEQVSKCISSIPINVWIQEVNTLLIIENMQRQGLMIDLKRYDEELQMIEQEMLDAKRDFNRIANGQLITKTLSLDTISEEIKEVLPEAIQYYEKYHKLKATLKNYSLDKVKKFRDIDGRFRCQWNSVGTVTRRITTCKPNLQGMPKRLRHHWVAPQGKVMIEVDYVAEEMMLLAYLADEQSLVQAIRQNIDLHKLTASLILKKQINDVEDAERTLGKKINFAVIYGAGNSCLQQQLKADGYDCSLDEISIFREQFYLMYEGIQKLQEQLTESNRLVTPGGTVWEGSSLPERYKRLNYLIQTTGSEVLKNVLLKLSKEMPSEWKLVFCIHDSILVEVPSKDRFAAVDFLSEKMKEGVTDYFEDAIVRVDIQVK